MFRAGLPHRSRCARGCGIAPCIRRAMRKGLLLLIVGAMVPGTAALDLRLPNSADSLKFAVIGDYGTGDHPSFEVAAQMSALRARFPFELVLTTGDNILKRQ